MKIICMSEEPIPNIRVTCKDEKCKALLEIEPKDLERIIDFEMPKRISFCKEKSITYYVYECPVCKGRFILYMSDFPINFMGKEKEED